MINITYLSDGKIMHGGIEVLDHTKSEIWVFCLNPSKSEMKDVSEKADIPYDDMARALDEDERPSIYDFDSYSRLTFHAPFLNKNRHYITVPMNILIKNKIIILLSLTVSIR